MNLNEIIEAWGKVMKEIPFETFKPIYKRLKNNELVLEEYKERFKKKRKK